MNWQVLIAYLFGLGLIYLFVWIMYYPLKITTKIILNGLAGVLVLILINFVGKFLSFSIPVNPVTAIIVGFLGIPGVILLILVNFFIL